MFWDPLLCEWAQMQSNYWATGSPVIEFVCGLKGLKYHFYRNLAVKHALAT